MLLGHEGARRELQRAETEIERLEAVAFDPDAVASLQARKLERLWARAAETDHYGPIVRGRPPSLELVPVTPKALVRANPGRFLAPAAARPLRYYESSGTTGGVPLASPRLAEDIVWNTVTLASAWRTLLLRGARAAILLPSDVAPVGDTMSATCDYLGVAHVRCYPFALGICDFERVQDIFVRFRPDYVFAAPGLLLQLMRALKRRRTFRDASASISRILLLGEVATRSLRQMLAREWHANVYDASYGSTETGTIAATCSANRLHVLAHAFVAEVEDSGSVVPLADRAEGSLVVSALNSFARPLLRYATDDRIADDGRCACGLRLPTLVVRGRGSETVAVDGATHDVSAVESVVYACPGITGYVIELADGAARLVLERDVDADVDDREVAARVGDSFAARGVAFDHVAVVSQLPALSKSGAGQKNWKKTNVRAVA
jgi:phenylacetate-CoA ligase